MRAWLLAWQAKCSVLWFNGAAAQYPWMRSRLLFHLHSLLWREPRRHTTSLLALGIWFGIWWAPTLMTELPEHLIPFYCQPPVLADFTFPIRWRCAGIAVRFGSQKKECHAGMMEPRALLLWLQKVRISAMGDNFPISPCLHGHLPSAHNDHNDLGFVWPGFPVCSAIHPYSELLKTFCEGPSHGDFWIVATGFSPLLLKHNSLSLFQSLLPNLETGRTSVNPRASLLN